MDVNMERLLQRHGRLQSSMPRILELNPNHGMVKKLAERAGQEGAGKDPLLRDAAHLLLDQARIADGEAPADPAEFRTAADRGHGERAFRLIQLLCCLGPVSNVEPLEDRGTRAV